MTTHADTTTVATLPRAMACPSTQAVHRQRTTVYRDMQARLLAECGAAVGRPLPAVERIARGEG